MNEPIRAAGYVRVSTDEQAEEGHSIYEQPRLIREFVDEQDWELVEMFEDPGFSGAREDRPALQRMLARLDEIDVIVVWAMDRLTRDVEFSANLTKRLIAADIRIESLTANVDLSTSEGRAMNNVSVTFGQFERERIGERVRAVLKGRKQDGLHNGGPPPDGWMDVPVEVKKVKGKDKTVYERVHDSERAPVIRHLFDLAEQGMPDGPLARHLNGEGYRTRSGRPWDRRSVQNHLTNHFHAGKVAHHRGKPNEEVYEGQHDHLIDPATFDRIQAARGERDLGAGQHVMGRPAHRHLLAKLARCGSCGSPMFAVTSSYRRKDGTKARQYLCRGYHTSDGTCSMKVDAEAIDAAVLEELPRLMPDFNRWIEQIEDRHAAERQRLEEARDRARDDRDAQRRQVEAAEDRWLALSADDQELLRGAVERAKRGLSDAETRLRATETALESVPQDVGHDRLLDFATSLRAVIAGKVDGDRSVGQLNRSLIELFSAFTIFREPPEDSLPEELDAALNTDAAYVCPNLRMEVFMRLLTESRPLSTQGGLAHFEEGEPEPPMEWIEALAKSANTHE